MQTLAQIKSMLESRGLAPRHRLGQNFLIDKNLVSRLADAAIGPAPTQPRTAPGPLVLEVGPGTGTLTQALLARGARVVAVELDAGLAALLRETAPAWVTPGGAFTLIEGDCLARDGGLNPDALAALDRLGASSPHRGEPFVLASNLPYAAGTPLLLALLTRLSHRCPRLAVTVQREVAQRLAAAPGGKDYGPLGIVAQAMATVETIARLPPECFWPRPEVESAMVLLRVRERPLTDDPARLASFCRRLFSSRRKQLGAILGRDHPWPPGVDPVARPEQLSVERIVELMRSVTPETDA